MLLHQEGKSEGWTIVGCQIEDMSPLSELRVRAIMPSLKAVNRFEAIRVVQRFSQDYHFQHTYKIMLDNYLAGFFMMREESEFLYFPYFYIDPKFQASQLGANVLENLIEKGLLMGKSVRIGALKGCQTELFYRQQGLVCSHEDARDVYYESRVEDLADRAQFVCV